MYTKGDLDIGIRNDSSLGYEQIYGAFLPHSCDEWVIGGIPEIENLIQDLQNALEQLKRKETGK